MANLARLPHRVIRNVGHIRLGWNSGFSPGRFYYVLSEVAPKPTESALCTSSYMVKATKHLCTQRTLTDSEIKRAVDNISEKFTEAMELMNDARSSVGTVYFSEDMEDTTAQVQETLQDYASLIAQLSEKQKKQVIQSIGLKMEELKAQMSLLQDLAKE